MDYTPPTEDEKVEFQACYAVVMQLAATRKVGVVGLVLLVLGAATAWWFASFWWFVGSAVLTFGAFHYVMKSCARFVTQTTDMPENVQAKFGRLYKSDPAFKEKVDDFERRARS